MKRAVNLSVRFWYCR